MAATDQTPKARILVGDDEAPLRTVLSHALRKEGYEVTTADDAPTAIELIRRGPAPDLLISDLKMPGGSGVDVLRALKEMSPDSVGLLLTAYASAETAVQATRLGAVDYLTKPFNVDDVRQRVARLIEAKRLNAERVVPSGPVAVQEFFPAGKSRRILDVILMIARAAQSDTNVLITGESGTGKEWTAREIHRQSKRQGHPFVAVNCGAFSESLLESELFGHMKGAFTGAVETKKGLFETAHGGTLFLDEVGETSLGMQVKLLRALQERRFRRVGGTQEVEANVRFIAATNRNLDEMVRQGSFREDFYFRINVISIRLPALRERPDDIEELAEHFLVRFAARMGRPMRGISPDARELLLAYHWPGNVRELENVIERGVALESAGELTPDCLPPHLLEPQAPAAGAAGLGAGGIPDAGFNLEEHLQEIERMHLERALKQAGGVQVRAAELLGITFRQFRYLAKKYQLR
jgi:two-component system response regulator PilR (NtrC family)